MSNRGFIFNCPHPIFVKAGSIVARSALLVPTWVWVPPHHYRCTYHSTPPLALIADALKLQGEGDPLPHTQPHLHPDTEVYSSYQTYLLIFIEPYLMWKRSSQLWTQDTKVRDCFLNSADLSENCFKIRIWWSDYNVPQYRRPVPSPVCHHPSLPPPTPLLRPVNRTNMKM